MADISKILDDMRAARQRGASEQDIKRLTEQVSRFSNESAGINEQIGATMRDINRTMMSAMKPNMGAIIAAATSASPVFAALRSIYEKQQAYREKIDAEASKDRQSQLELLNQELEQLKKDAVSQQSVEVEAPQVEPEVQREPNQFSEELLDVNQKQLEVLYELLGVWDSDNPLLQEMRATRQLMLEQEKARQEQADLEALARTENVGGESQFHEGHGLGKEAEEKKSMFDNILSSVVGGLSGALASMLAFGGILPLLKKALGALKVGPLALVAAVAEFGIGFFDAKDILGKADVTIAERLQAGAMQLLGSVGDLFDLGAELLGFETTVGDTIRGITRSILQYPVDILNHVTGYLSQAFDGIGLGTNLVDIPSIIFENVKGMIRNAVDNVVQMDLVERAQEKMSEVRQAAVDALSAKIESVGDVVSGFFLGVFDDLLTKVYDLVDWLPKWTPGRDTMLEQVKEFRANLKHSPETEFSHGNQQRMWSDVQRRANETEREFEDFNKPEPKQPDVVPPMLNNQVNSSQVNTYNPDRITAVDYSDKDFAGPQVAFGF